MKRIAIVLLAAVTAAICSTASFGANFYLSTEKSFMQGEDARVKIESMSTAGVTVRLYQITNAKDFLKTRKNMNRVYIDSEYIQKNPTELLFHYMNLFELSMRNYGHERVPNQSARQGAYGAFGEALEPREVKSQLIIGRLKEYRFIREYEQKLAGGEGWSFSYLELGALSNGLYLAEVYSQSDIAYTLVHVSRDALIVKKAESGMLLWSMDKKTGAGVKTEFSVFDFDSGKAVAKGTTAANGLQQFNLPKNKYSELLVYAEESGDFAFQKLSLYPTPEVERMVYLYTDSPIYKFGQQVHIKGVIRDFKNSAYQLPMAKDVTLSVTDPRGGSFTLKSADINAYGTFESAYDVPENAATGVYRVIATADGKTYAGEFRVENYVKPLFQVQVKPEKAVLVGGKTVKFKILAAYFTGGEVANAQVKWSLFRTPVREDLFESEKDVFEDPAYASKIEYLDTKEGTLDAKGELSAEFDPSKYKLDRDYAFIIKAEAADSALARASGSAKVKVVKSDFAIKGEIGKSVYLEGEDVRVLVKLAFADGSPAAKRKLQWKAVREEDKVTVGKGEAETDAKGGAAISFRASGKGYVRVEITAKDDYGNEAVENVFTWFGQEGGTFVYSSGDITIVFDKAEYAPGDTAKVLVVSPVSRVSALWTTEREEIYAKDVANLAGNTLLLNLPIQREYTPNFFFSVSFVLNGQLYENAVKVKVPPNDRMLTVKVTTDKAVYRPGEKGKARVEVKDAAGKPVKCELSLSAVDEALYRVGSDLFPDPRLFFYSYRWNSVMSANSIALRFYGYSRSMREKYAMGFYKKKIWDFEDMQNERVRYAGVKEATQKLSDEGARKAFKDQIHWSPRVETDDKGAASFDIEFPENLTEWRFTAVAFSKDTRVGRSTASARTFLDFAVLLNAPEHLTWADKARAFVTVMNRTSQKRTVNLKATSENGRAVLDQTQVQVAADSDVSVPLSITANDAGKARFLIEADGGDKKDSAVQTLLSTPVSLQKIYYETKLVQTSADNLHFTLPSGVVPGTLSATVGLTEMENPFGAVVTALPYLKSYPYGCVEQTTSAFLPNLVAFEAAKKLKLELPAAFADLDAVMQKGLSALYGFQNASGGWGWWGEGAYDTWMTAYVLYALNFVKRTAPEKLNNDVWKRGVAALEASVKYGIRDDSQLAWAIYVLSDCGSPVAETVKKLAAQPGANAYSLALLAIAAQKTGLESEAAALCKLLDKSAVQERFYSYWSSQTVNYWYGDSVICTAAVLRAFAATGYKTDNRDRALAYLLQARQGNIWGYTRNTAEAVYAIADYAAAGYAKVGASEVDVLFDGKKAGSFSFGGKAYKNTLPLAAADVLSPGIHTVAFNVPKGMYVGDLRVEYHTKELSIAAESQGVTLSRKYYRVLDKRTLEPLTGSPQLKAGETVLVEITAKADKPLDYVVVEDGIPAGFVPVWKVNEYQLGFDFKKGIMHQEFGRGKASFFFRNFNSFTVRYLIQANWPGVYYAVPTLAYAMYQPEQRGNSASSILEVTE